MAGGRIGSTTPADLVNDPLANLSELLSVTAAEIIEHYDLRSNAARSTTVNMVIPTALYQAARRQGPGCCHTEAALLAGYHRRDTCCPRVDETYLHRSGKSTLRSILGAEALNERRLSR